LTPDYKSVRGKTGANFFSIFLGTLRLAERLGAIAILCQSLGVSEREQFT
jgi:hypothetical protein